MQELLENLAEQDILAITVRSKDGKALTFRREGNGYIIASDSQDIVRLEPSATGFKPIQLSGREISRGSWECYEACINSCGPSLGCAKLCGEKCGIS